MGAEFLVVEGAVVFVRIAVGAAVQTAAPAIESGQAHFLAANTAPVDLLGFTRISVVPVRFGPREIRPGVGLSTVDSGRAAARLHGAGAID